MTSSELKMNVDRTGSYFFTRSSMKFFGDRMSNYGVRSTKIKSIECWELYRKKPVVHGLTDSAYFRKDSFERQV